MPVIRRLLKPLHQAVVAFFSHDLAFKRSRQGLEVVLERRPRSKSRKVSQQEAKAQQEREELRQMLQELDALLDEQPGSRQTLRHISFLQEALNKKGLRALHKVPLDVLQRALEQLESLVTNWSPVGLANLRSKMAVAIIDREHMDPDAEAEAYKTSALMDSGLGVPGLPDVEVRTDDEALAAAYASLSAEVPSHAAAQAVKPAVEVQAELGSRSAKAVAAPLPRASEHADHIELRVLQD